MHFLFSLFFLILIILLAFLYIVGPYVLFVFVIRCWLVNSNYEAEKTKKDKIKDLFRNYMRKKVLLTLICILVIYHALFYVQQRAKWMGSDNANLKAKEYYVSGQVLYGFRRILTVFLNPSNYIMWPLNGMQQWIYDRGMEYLPECDGERGVWLNNWFVYPFSKRDKKPWGTDKFKPSPNMMTLVENQWISIEKMATCPFADKQMEIQHYYRNFPGMTFYYNMTEGYLTGRFSGSGSVMAKNERFIQRSKSLVEWLISLREKWKHSPEALEFIQAHPKIEAMLQATLIFELSEVIESRIWSREFRCDCPYVKLYIMERNKFIGTKNKLPLHKRMKEKAQAKTLYNIIVSSLQGRFMKYTLKKYCKITVPGKEDNSSWEGWVKSPEKKYERKIVSLYHNEIKILEEIYHARRSAKQSIN